MRLILAAIIAVLVDTAGACFAPIGGPEYDALVEIEKLEEPNRYRVAVPRHMEGMVSEAEIILAYGAAHGRGIPVYEPFEVLHSIVDGRKLVATFYIEKRKDERPYIVVMWWPYAAGMCGIQANSGFLAE